jgi:HEAT repeat protein
MVNAIKNATPTRLYATLEYGERVECFECIPGLTEKLLSSNDAEVREISAWWLRRRSFGFGPVMAKMQQVAREDTDPVRRARAASALGEFLDPHGSETLSTLARSDADVTVRVTAVRALGRLNTLSAHAALSSAMHDADPQVRLAALQQVLKVNFFSDMDSLLGLLGDPDLQVRNLAVQLTGELRLTAASDALLGVLMTDDSVRVRQSAAIALGHIGGVDAGEALSDAMTVEKDSAVQDAISIARRMR